MIATTKCGCISLEQSKFFGEAYLPEEWLEEDVFLPDEFFVAQLSVEELKSAGCQDLSGLQGGYLYFFVNAPSEKKSTMRAVVRYYNGEPSACTDFNDGFFEDDLEEFALGFGGGNFPLFIKDGENVIAFTLTESELPILKNGEIMQFVIGAESLKNGDFGKFKLKFN